MTQVLDPAERAVIPASGVNPASGVIPAKAGIPCTGAPVREIPACAGMTAGHAGMTAGHAGMTGVDVT
jgi:hypothetical protein